MRTPRLISGELCLAQAACRAAPDFADFINTLGVAYYRAGKYREAVAALEKSLPEDTTNGVDACDLYFLAMCHYRLGDAAKVRECLEVREGLAAAERGTHAGCSAQLDRFRSEAEALHRKPAE